MQPARPLVPGAGEAALAEEATSTARVVVELGEDKVKGTRGESSLQRVIEGTLRSGRQVVLLALISGEQLAELLSKDGVVGAGLLALNIEVETVNNRVAKRAGAGIVSRDGTKDGPELLGDGGSLFWAGEAHVGSGGIATKGKQDLLTVGLANLDAVDEAVALVEDLGVLVVFRRPAVVGKVGFGEATGLLREVTKERKWHNVHVGVGAEGININTFLAIVGSQLTVDSGGGSLRGSRNGGKESGRQQAGGNSKSVHLGSKL